MAERLTGKTIAILAADGFEQVELTEPMKALKDAGATVEIVSPKQDEIQGFNHFDKGDAFKVDRALGAARQVLRGQGGGELRDGEDRHQAHQRRRPGGERRP